jgi:hypothetical protein
MGKPPAGHGRWRVTQLEGSQQQQQQHAVHSMLRRGDTCVLLRCQLHVGMHSGRPWCRERVARCALCKLLSWAGMHFMRRPCSHVAGADVQHTQSVARPTWSEASGADPHAS